MKAKLLTLVLAALILTGCLGGGPGGTANVGIYLTETAGCSLNSLDSPALADIAQVWVTVDKVTARVDGRWVTLLLMPQDAGKINLKELRFREQLLGTATIPAGRLTELRLELKENQAGGPLHNYIVLKDGQTVALQVPSGQLKPELNLSIAQGSALELVFDVHLPHFVERGTDGSYIVNPRKALVLIDSYRDRFASIRGEIQLPAGIDKFIAIEINLFRAKQAEPIWTAYLHDDRLSFEVTSLPEGEYRLEASIELMGAASLTLTSGPFHLEAGTSRAITLKGWGN